MGQGATNGGSGAPSASVAIVSQGRPALLRRAVLGVRQLYCASVELVVVADQPGLDAIADMPGAGLIKTACFDTSNISMARNIALGLAAGDVVAFLDDDAVPEPTWLDRLCAAFADPSVGAATGPVRGRNGISYQSFAPQIDRLGQTQEGASAQAGAMPKLVGTNMAVRRSTVVALGGFDERYRFYLEDADLSVRLVEAGHSIARIEDAQVHHAFAPSRRRRADRFPKQLADLGRSAGVFIATHTPQREAETAKALFVAAERKRLVRHLIAGSCEPRDVRRGLAEHQSGLEEGLSLVTPGYVSIGPPPPFQPCAGHTPIGHAALAGRARDRVRTLRDAKALVDDGYVVSAFVFSASTLFHHVRFSDDGVWVQTGGQFGRSLRNGAMFQPVAFRDRVERELLRVRSVRCRQENDISSQIRWI